MIELESLLEIDIEHFLFLAAIIFVIGLLGVLINRKSLIVILMSIELMLLAININFVAFSTYLNDLTGQIFTIFILTVAAAEAAIALAILVVFYRNSNSVSVDMASQMRG